MEMLDVRETLRFQLRRCFAAAKTARAIHQHWLGLVQSADFLLEIRIADGDVNRIRQRAAAELGVGADVEHLRVRMRIKECFCLLRMNVHADAPGLALEQFAIPSPFIPIPGEDDERDDDEGPDHECEFRSPAFLGWALRGTMGTG